MWPAARQRVSGDGLRHRLDGSERAAGVTDQNNRIMEEN
jgi:hypothetical protein